MWRVLTRALPRQSCARFSSFPLPLPLPLCPYSRRPFSTIPSTDAAALSSNKPVANLGETKPLPKSAKIVIIGGGVVGSSVAYHLAKFGAKDVVLIESGQLGCGTTWHAAGLVGQMRSTAQETQLSGVYGTKLYAELESETGFATGFRRCGSLTVARTDDRMTLLRRNASRARAYGIDAEMVDAKRAGELWPWMRWDDLKGALWLPGDGSVTSSDLTASLAAGAKQRGVRIYERTRVTSIQTSSGHVRSVATDRGTIECDVIVNCGGQWARKIGQMAGVNVPLHSAEHFYIVTNAFNPPISPMCPVMRDPDVYTYYREWSGGLVMGGFEPVCKPCFTDGIPDNFEFSLLPEDWDHFSVLMQGALERVPALETAQVRMVNGPESFTPDNQYILGEAPGLRRFYVAAGFNSSGVASAGGAGKALAEWIIADEPTMDLWSVDIRRFAPFMNNINFLRDRTFETLGLHYQITWPKRELVSARPLRRSPLYSHLKAANAYFGSKFGWERPNWFAPKGVTPTMEYSFGRQNWFPYVASEHHTCRNDVALFDQSSFVKFILQGRDAVQVMQRLCCNDVDVEIGKVVYTGMLNRKGGMETDITVTRIASDAYFMVTSTAQGTRDADWIKRNFKKDEFVTLTDVTSAYATLSVMGPKSRQLLERISKADLSNTGFPFSTSREIDIGYANVRATRITYVGELGWELYVPTEFATSVYELLHEKGADLGLRDAGYYAIDSLRLEKAYRAWGHELSPDYTPYQSGLGFAVKLDKGCDFIGRDALIEAKKQGVTKRLAIFTFDDSQAYPLGDEPILRNGELVGYISSAGYGHTLGRAIGMGYVRNTEGEADKSWIESGTYQVEISGKPWSVKASLQPAYDPKGDRIKV